MHQNSDERNNTWRLHPTKLFNICSFPSKRRVLITENSCCHRLFELWLRLRNPKMMKGLIGNFCSCSENVNFLVDTVDQSASVLSAIGLAWAGVVKNGNYTPKSMWIVSHRFCWDLCMYCRYYEPFERKRQADISQTGSLIGLYGLPRRLTGFLAERVSQYQLQYSKGSWRETTSVGLSWRVGIS